MTVDTNSRWRTILRVGFIQLFVDQKRDTSKKLSTLPGDKMELACIMLCNRQILDHRPWQSFAYLVVEVVDSIVAPEWD